MGKLIKNIQDADRGARFVIDGIIQHIITIMMEERRKERKKRNNERLGVAAQRYTKRKLV